MGLRLEVAIDQSAHKIAIDELHRNARGCEKISGVFSQKPIDKPLPLWYNKGVKREAIPKRCELRSLSAGGSVVNR